MTPLEVDALNAADEAATVAALAPLFEGAPGFLARVAKGRPYRDWPALFHLARAIAHAMPAAEQIELIDAHPRLGAPPATVSALSFREQGYRRAAIPAAELDVAAEADVAAELDRLNAAYEVRFGFRYCVFVAGRPRPALLPEMEAALSADREAEIHRALEAVVDIAAARLEVLRGPGT